MRGQLGREYALIIGGHRVKTEGKIRSLNPARPAQVVGVHQKAGAEHAEQAMQAALRGFRVLEPDFGWGEDFPAAWRCGDHSQAEVRVLRVADVRGWQELGRGRRGRGRNDRFS